MFINQNKNIFGLRWLCKRLSIYPSSYYNYEKNKLSKMVKLNIILTKIKQLYYNNNKVYGHRLICHFLKLSGVHLSKTTVHKYMNKMLGLHSIIMKRSYKFTRNINNYYKFPNLIKQNFSVLAKNKVWCMDFTYIKLINGKTIYNCSIIDLFDRSIIATVNSKNIDSALAINTLSTAILSESPRGELIVHTDHGSQFTSQAFRDFCLSQKITQSMSRPGCPYDNAVIERFFNTLKQSFVNIQRFKDIKDFDSSLKNYIFLEYNFKRPHMYNNGLTPFEARNLIIPNDVLAN